MATARRALPTTIAAALFALWLATLPLMLVVPQSRSMFSLAFHRAKIYAIDLGVLRYDHSMDACLDRLSSLDALANTGQIKRLRFAFNGPLSSEQRILIGKTSLPHLDLLLETGKQTEVLVFVEDSQTLELWKSYLHEIQKHLEALGSSENIN